MKQQRDRVCRRKAIWLAFAFAAFTTVASAQDVGAVGRTLDVNPDEDSKHSTNGQAASNQIAEAEQVYEQATAALKSLTYHGAPTLPESFMSGYKPPPTPSYTSILYAMFPAPEGRGPIASAARIFSRLHDRVFKVVPSTIKDFSSRKKDEDMRRRAIKVIGMLRYSAQLGNTHALYSLAQISLFPPTEHFPSNPKLAYESFVSHAAQTGSAASQSYMAFFYATGYHGVVPVNQGKAQLFYTFAANGGDQNARLALGYRYLSGIGTVEDCDRALEWYGQAVEHSLDRFLSGPPGGLTLPDTATKISDLAGGVYGSGASVASSNINVGRAAIRAFVSHAAGETWEDILEYSLFNANRREPGFAYQLGKIYYQGSIYAVSGGIASGSEGVGAIPRDFKRAQHYFLEVARERWAVEKDGQPHQPLKKDELRPPAGWASPAACYLGRMYLRGEGVRADHKLAKLWFDRGIDYGEKECYNGLGIMYNEGLIPGPTKGKPNPKKAIAHFNAAAIQDLAEAHVHLGKIYLEVGETATATSYLETAARLGSQFEAFYHLGTIHASQATSPKIPPNMASGSCQIAVSYFKHAVERGRWDGNLLREAEISWMTGSERGRELALLKWQIAAETGSEIAQNNIAYVYDQDKSMLRRTRLSPIPASNETATLALTNWIRAAAQRNVDALVKVGDYYYHGLGVANETEGMRFEKAAKYYQSAADTQLSSLAMWNLGWMHENGVGVPQDFHLAKRHYDLAYVANADAYLPVKLSLLKLYAKSVLHTLRGGTNGLSLWTPDESDVPPKVTAEAPALGEGQTGDDQLDDGTTWYGGKEKHGSQQQGNAHPEEDDIIQWTRGQRLADQERETEFGPEDYFDGAARQARRQDGEADDFPETMIILVLCLAVSLLIYLRTRIVDRIRRNQQDGPADVGVAPPENNNNGVFPAPGDPARNDWAIQR